MKWYVLTISFFMVLLIGIKCNGFSFSYFLEEDYDAQIDEWKLWLYGKSKTLSIPVIHSIFDRNGVLIGEMVPVRGSHLTLNQCKDLYWLKVATVVSEDKNFYQHKGISYKGIARAIFYNIKTFSLSQGGGTITQQLARNLFTGQEKSFQRKILETLLAKKLEEKFTKEEILCLYLNKIYMGEGRYGAEEASWFYFNQPPDKLSAAEASFLVGMFPAPSKYSPIRHLKKALKKQNIVLSKLVESGYLTEKQKKIEIKKFYKKYNINITKEATSKIAQYGASKYFRLNQAPTVNEYVRKFIQNHIPKEFYLKKHLKIYTAIDKDSQKYALLSLKNYLESIRRKNQKKYIPYTLSENLSKNIEGVLVSIDIPSGHVRALVGGYEVTDTGILNYRIFTMKRQVGSTIKGFLYALALERGIYDIDSKVIDEPVNFNGYKPGNWYQGFLGEISLRKAIARSVNTIAVKTLSEMGINYFRDELAQALGLSYYMARKRFPGNLTIALGTFELTPWELTLLYGAILNEGYKVNPILIQRIEDSDGIVLYEDYTEQKETTIVDSNASAKILELLRSVVEEESGTAGWIGRMKKKYPELLPYEIAGKSGTTQFPNKLKKRYGNISGIRDSWFVGMIPVNVTTIWIGHDKGAPFEGKAVLVWVNYIKQAFPDPIPQKFPQYKKESWFDFFHFDQDDFSE